MLCSQALLAEQIAAKEREKLAARHAKEEAEAVEEARIAREKEALKRQYEQDMLSRQQKEVSDITVVIMLELKIRQILMKDQLNITSIVSVCVCRRKLKSVRGCCNVG